MLQQNHHQQPHPEHSCPKILHAAPSVYCSMVVDSDDMSTTTQTVAAVARGRNIRIGMIVAFILVHLLNCYHQYDAEWSVPPPAIQIAVLVSNKDEKVDILPPATALPSAATIDIPAMMHFVHISDDLYSNVEFPDNVKRNIDDWRELHPKWEIKTWSNAEIRNEFQELMPLLSRITGPRSWVSNLVRYAVLLRFGGIYLDTDIVPIRPLDPLLSLQNFTVCESPYHDTSDAPELPEAIVGWRVCDRACNAVIGAKKGNIALGKVLERSKSNTRTELMNKSAGSYKLSLTGPPVWTRVAGRHRINVLHEKTFFPCSYKDIQNCNKTNFLGKPNTFAMHQWAKSWKKKSKNNATATAVNATTIAVSASLVSTV